MDKVWWKSAVAYQAYVRSFKDSDGDGIGDLNGIIEKLDYLKELGVDILYLNPINKSPNYDNGYDISDYRDIMDQFGTLEDFNNLVRELKNRGMKIVLDFVINHTSHEHPWFVESRKGKDNPYRDYYIWQQGKGENPPNNWGSFFGGSVWEYDETSEEYYFHIFAKEQPDLNWRNEKLREEVKEMFKYWIEKGIDGFRLDAINHIEKDFSFPNGVVNKDTGYGNGIKYVQNLPEVHMYLKELKRDVFNAQDCLLIGEIGGINHENAFIYTGKDRKELDMIFHFDMHTLGDSKEFWKKRKFDLVKDIKSKMNGWQMREDEEGWCPLFYSNHDTTRTVSRIGDDEKYWKESAKMLATIQLTQKGTPFIYYGDEIGMTNGWDYQVEDYKDISAITNFDNLVSRGVLEEENYLKGLHHTSRDNSRTPMQWDESNNAGFTAYGEPWIKVNSNYKEINVAKQFDEKDSILSFYKSLIKLRKANEVLIYGKFIELNKDHKDIYSYIRELNGDRILVIANFFGDETEFILPDKIEYEVPTLLLSNYDGYEEEIRTINLKPYEVRIYRL